MNRITVDELADRFATQPRDRLIMADVVEGNVHSPPVSGDEATHAQRVGSPFRRHEQRQ